MRYLEDHSEQDYHFIYIITESISDQEDFFRRVLEELLKSEIIQKVVKASEKSKDLISGILNRIKSISIPVISLELNQEEHTSYQKEFEELLFRLDTEGNRIVLMIDEFPQTVENIRSAHGNQAAIDFLQINRELRQKAENNIQFILTGSIGLPAIVKQLGTLKVINDLNMVEIGPLSDEEATQMTVRILDNYRVTYTVGAIQRLLAKIHWLIPFHIQLACQEIIDVYDNGEQEISEADVEKAFDRITNHRNDIYFDSYYARLRDVFDKDSHQYVIELLNRLSQNDTLSKTALTDLALTMGVDDNLTAILDSLLYDGYINNHPDPEEFRFNSSILKLWWMKYRT